ncbi:MAG: YesL family protein [Lachnospiraceae bacterium]
MAGFFNADNKLWSSVNSAVDAVLLNIMWLFTCIPIFTIGAATTAFYYTTHKVIRNQRSGIWKEYWASFKANFKQATKTWLIFLAIFVIFYFDISICTAYLEAGEKIGIMAYFFYGLLAVVLIWFMYVFAYMARFEDDSKTTLKNAAIMAFTNLRYSLIVLVLVAGTIYVCKVVLFFSWFIPAIAMVFLNVVLEKVFRKYMSEEELAEEQQNDMMRR